MEHSFWWLITYTPDKRKILTSVLRIKMKPDWFRLKKNLRSSVEVEINL